MNNNNISEQNINDIIKVYEERNLLMPEAGQHGTDPLWPRLHRAAVDQLNVGEATLSRYVIWANTVLNNITAALDAFDCKDDEQARYLLIRAANSLSAFAEIQKLFSIERKSERV